MNKVHFIGIGGIGMSALAMILAQQGVSVTGSDLASNYITEELQNQGIKFLLGHNPRYVEGASYVVYSSAVGPDNPEYLAAKKLNIPLKHRSLLLRELFSEQRPLLVSGTHGKTTTSALLAHTLVDVGLDPSYAIGGSVLSLGGNGKYGRGPYFVAEADESDGSFLQYHPFGAILTNIDTDHLDYWRNSEALTEGFRQFASQVALPGLLLWCADDLALTSLGLKGVSYGFSPKADICIENYCQHGWKNVFDLSVEGNRFLAIEIPLIGAHNVQNAAAVFGLLLRLGISESRLRRAFSRFQGVKRRAEKKGEKKGIVVYDDYAHHPTEIFATLHAFKSASPQRRLVVAFQPHRYSRTRYSFDQFPEALAIADDLVLTDIYAAGEAPIAGISSQVLLSKIPCRGKFHPQYVPRTALAAHLAHTLREGDLLITMGAGDVTKVGSEVLEKL